jgi:polyhydroxybutyrate depolymerase
MICVGAEAFGQGVGGDARCGRLAPGDFTCTLGSRQFLVHVPASYSTARAAPLVVDMHGLGSSASSQRGLSGWLRASNEIGAVVVYPQGLSNSWNSQGQCCGTSNRRGVDDIGFVKQVVAAVQAAGNIDRTNVIATGLSNGGFMTHTLACEAADVFTSAFPVAAQLSGGGGGGNRAFIAANCTPARPIDVLHFHGTSDGIVSYANGVLDSLGSLESRQAWAQIQGCSATPAPRVIGNVTCTVHAGCRGGVSTGLCSVSQGRHVLYRNLRGTTVPDESLRFIGLR